LNLDVKGAYRFNGVYVSF